MKTCAATLGLFVLLSTVRPSICQHSTLPASGVDWMQQTKEWKLAFAFGWRDGESSAINRECYDAYTTSSDAAFERAKQKLSALPRECSEAGTTPNPAQFNSCVDAKGNSIKAQLNREHEQLQLKLKSCRKQERRSLGIPPNYTMGQFVEGVDHFYADYRNRMLPAQWVAEEVEKQIDGATDAEIEADLELDRKVAQSSAGSNDYRK